ncbi:16202_t:CDS:2, partial [Gigaspora margarita]
DFNTNQKRKGNSPLLSYMSTIGYVSIMEAYNITEPTWSRKDLHSQIDDLWLPPDTIMDFEIPVLRSAEDITNSDHKILEKQYKKVEETMKGIQEEKQLDNLWLIWNTVVKTAANKVHTVHLY